MLKFDTVTDTVCLAQAAVGCAITPNSCNSSTYQIRPNIVHTIKEYKECSLIGISTMTGAS